MPGCTRGLCAEESLGDDVWSSSRLVHAVKCDLEAVSGMTGAYLALAHILTEHLFCTRHGVSL